MAHDVSSREAASDDWLLRIRGLRTEFPAGKRAIRAVDNVDLDVKPGEILGVVGESGCGKSITARSILQIVSTPGRVVAGEMLFRRADGTVVDIAKLDPRSTEMRAIRGKEISMIFQEPMSSLAPIHTIGSQIVSAIRLHLGLDKAAARKRATEVLGRVGMPRPETQLDRYTFQLSGGMRQRAMIALALSCSPRLLIADEPTTALDVTTQAVILDLLKELQEDLGMAVLFITHDLGAVAELTDLVAVMYLGKVVERATVDHIFHRPMHPYTRALLRSVPRVGIGVGEPLDTIEGGVPHPFRRPSGCPFHPRCPEAMPDVCPSVVPTEVHLPDGGSTRCLLYGSAEERQSPGRELERSS